MDINNPSSETVESPSTVEANVNQDHGINVSEFWDKSTDVSQDTPETVESEAPAEVVENAEVVEDNSKEEETFDDGSGKGNDPEVVEVDPEAKADLEPEVDPETIEDTREIVNYDDLEHYIIDIEGQQYDRAQLKALIGQSEATGTKSREASDLLKSAEVKIAELDKREADLQTQVNGAKANDQLAQMYNKGNALQNELATAKTEGDMFEVTRINEDLKDLTRDINQAKADVKKSNDISFDKAEKSAIDGLKAEGYEYLTKKGTGSDNWTAYAKGKLTESQLDSVSMIPALAIAVEKARKFDLAQGKTHGKIKATSNKVLTNGTGNAIESRNTKEDNARDARMSNNTATADDINFIAKRAASTFWDK